MNNYRWHVPRWLLFPLFGVLIFSGLIGLLVYAARQQPADSTQCLKISPDGEHIYFDTHSGTRFNMPLPTPPAGQFNQFSAFVGVPGDVYRAAIWKAVATPHYYIVLENLINGTRRIHDLGIEPPNIYVWSPNGKYLALGFGYSPRTLRLTFLSVNDLSELATFPGFPQSGAWFPEDNRFVYLKIGNNHELYLSIVSADNPSSPPITTLIAEDDRTGFPNGSVTDVRFEWSPDRQYIAIIGYNSAGIIPADGGSFQLVSGQAAAVKFDKKLSVHWSPTGHNLLYTETLYYPFNLMIFHPENGQRELLATDLADAPLYSPDGHFAILSRSVAPDQSVAYSLMDFSTNKETSVVVGKPDRVDSYLTLHWSEDSKAAAIFLQDGLVSVQVTRKPTAEVNKTAMARLWNAQFLPNSSWLTFLNYQSNSIINKHYMNLETNEHYVREVPSADLPYLDEWLDRNSSNLQDAYTHALRQVSSDGSLIRMIDPTKQVLPWFANTKILAYMDSSSLAALNLYSNNGRLLWEIRDLSQIPGNWYDNWIACSSLT